MRIIVLLGLCALLFVGACMTGIIKNAPQTGAPSVSLDGISVGGISMDSIDKVALPSLKGFSLPRWAYSVEPQGLTVKTLRAGDGEAVLVCSDGYTMLVGGGGNGIALTAQLLLCGVNRLHAAVATGSADEQVGGLSTAVSLLKPDYLLLQDTQTKGRRYNAMVQAADKSDRTQIIAPQQGLTFSLGRATVTVIGPASIMHVDERDDGLSLRVDYGASSVLIMGGITAGGEEEIISSGAPLDADALICAMGGSEEATGLRFAQAVSPSYALMTGKADNSVRVRLQRMGTQVYTEEDRGVMTLYSDGHSMSIQP